HVGASPLVQALQPKELVGGVHLVVRIAEGEEDEIGLEDRQPFGRLVHDVMRRRPYRKARRVFWIVDNGSSHQQRCTSPSGKPLTECLTDYRLLSCQHHLTGHYPKTSLIRVCGCPR